MKGAADPNSSRWRAAVEVSKESRQTKYNFQNIQFIQNVNATTDVYSSNYKISSLTPFLKSLGTMKSAVQHEHRSE